MTWFSSASCWPETGCGSRRASPAREIICVCHDLTRYTRPALIDGTVDAIVNQDAGHEVRSAARVLTALCEGADVVPGRERIRIDVFFRDNLPDA